MTEKAEFQAIRSFIEKNYKHFNAAVVIDAASAWETYLAKGGKMLVTLGGAMSTAELGITLGELICRGKVHAICCTGANLEEDLFNLVAHEHYKRVPNYRDLTPKDELALRDDKMNRVTDTCIPEEEAMRALEKHLWKVWEKADRAGERYFPYEYIYQLLDAGALKDSYQIDPKHSWVVSAWEKKLPIFVPGWEDSTLGNEVVAGKLKKDNPGGTVGSFNSFKSGLEVMEYLVGWYKQETKGGTVGFFQIGGGISGDFPICAVPLIIQDMKEEVPLWGYFCQISEAATSYGSYSGAHPNEKITWGKLGEKTPKFVIESDATIVAPLIFAYLLAGSQ